MTVSHRERITRVILIRKDRGRQPNICTSTEITRFGSIANIGPVSVPNASCIRNPGIAGARESLQTEAAIISEMWRRAFRRARELTVYYRLPTGISLHEEEGFGRHEETGVAIVYSTRKQSNFESFISIIATKSVLWKNLTTICS